MRMAAATVIERDLPIWQWMSVLPPALRAVRTKASAAAKCSAIGASGESSIAMRRYTMPSAANGHGALAVTLMTWVIAWRRSQPRDLA